MDNITRDLYKVELEGDNLLERLTALLKEAKKSYSDLGQAGGEASKVNVEALEKILPLAAKVQSSFKDVTKTFDEIGQSSKAGKLNDLSPLFAKLEGQLRKVAAEARELGSAEGLEGVAEQLGNISKPGKEAADTTQQVADLLSRAGLKTPSFSWLL